MLKTRYDKVYTETADVPGQKLPKGWARKIRGTPTNCRRLLKNPPPAPPAAEKLPVPPEVHRWVPRFLKKYQRRAIRWALNRPSVNLWMPCGSGKTVTATYLALAWAQGAPIVIVTNARVRGQFARAVCEFTKLDPVIADGQTPFDIPAGTRIVVTAWETLPHWRHELVSFLGRHGVVVFDEIHRAKNRTRYEKKYDPALRRNVYNSVDNWSSSAAAIALHAARRVCLTATPFANTLDDLWSQLDVLEPWCWGGSWDFVHRYCDAKPGGYGGLDTSGRSNTAELNLRLREVCYVVTKDEARAELPPWRREVVYIAPEDQVLPDGIRAELKRAAKQGSNAVLEVRLTEACARKRKWIAERVLESLAAKQKVVVLTGRRRDVERLREAVEAKALKLGARCWFGYGEGDDEGGTVTRGAGGEDRALMAAAYSKTEGPALLVGTVDAFGESIDGLQTTDLAIMAMLPYTHLRVDQAEGRFVGRLGQDRPVLILYPIAEGTIEEHVADLLLDKLAAITETVAELGVQQDAGTVADALVGEMTDEELHATLLAKL